MYSRPRRHDIFAVKTRGFAVWPFRRLGVFVVSLIISAGAALFLATSPAFAEPPGLEGISSSMVSSTCQMLDVTVTHLDRGTLEYQFEYLSEKQYKEDGNTFGEGTVKTPEETEHLGIEERKGPSAEVCGLALHTSYVFRALVNYIETPPGGLPSNVGSFSTIRFPSHELSSTIGTAPSDPVPLAGPSDIAINHANGNLYVTDPGIDNRQRVIIEAKEGTYTLSFGGQTTEPLPFETSYYGPAGQVQQALESIPAIGAHNIKVESIGRQFSGPEILDVVFAGALSGRSLGQIKADGGGLTGEETSATVSTIATGVSGAAVEEFTSSGQFVLIFGREVDKTKVTEREEGKAISEAEEDVCTAASGDKCQAGSPAPMTPECEYGGNRCEDVVDVESGQFESPAFLAVDNSPGGGGDVYVADTGTHLVQKFDAEGHVILSWGQRGQQDGPTSEEGDNTFPEIPYFGRPCGIAVDPEGKLFVGTPTAGCAYTYEYTRAGEFVVQFDAPGSFLDVPSFALKTDDSGRAYGAGGSGNPVQVISRFESTTGSKINQYTNIGPTAGIGLDPSYESPFPELYQDSGTAVYHYGSDCSVSVHPCRPIDAFGVGQLSNAAGLAVGSQHQVYVADTGNNRVAVFSDIRPAVTTESSKAVSETALTLTGHIDTETNGVDHGPVEECFFEWGKSTEYGHIAPCSQSVPIEGSTEVSAEITNLPPITTLPVGTRYHYRLLAANRKGALGVGHDATAKTTAPPLIEATSTSHVAATSAQLEGTISANGLPTKYFFEYGPTTGYGQSTTPDKLTEDLFEPQKVKVTIEQLQRGVTYHFRLVAENELDTGNPATSEDQTFEFYPPACPNSTVRQQTGSAYLPDCRAYELVSPPNAGGTFLVPGGPSASQATSPSRFAFVGDYGTIPGSNAINTGGDLYLATRTDTGWVTHYIGLPANEASCMGGSPNSSNSYQAFTNPTESQETVLADPSLSRILDWRGGSAIGSCGAGGSLQRDADEGIDQPSDAPYLWNAEDSLVSRLPSDLLTTPGALTALECPYAGGPRGYCTGEVTASGDLNHLIFSSRTFDFAEGNQAGQGLNQAPGSAYDDDIETGKINLVSNLKKSGQPIPQDPAFTPSYFCGAGYQSICYAEEFLRFPGVSANGSHILISTASTAQAGLDFCNKGGEGCPGLTTSPINLYMSINDEGAVEVSKSELTGKEVPVNYVGMTEDGSKVFFTSETHLTSEDPQHGGAALYMWSQKGEEENPPHPLTLISKADPGSPPNSGNTTECSPEIINKPVIFEGRQEEDVPWTTGCSAVPYTSLPVSERLPGAVGGNTATESAVASRSGDIYFYSPEQLDGNRGVPGLANLYGYYGGTLHFIATLNPNVHCTYAYGSFEETLEDKVCSAGSLVNFNTSPDGAHVAFTTSTQLTTYENQGHVEMYSYTPATGAIVCDSCNPSGAPATEDVHAAQDGLFMTNDGRTFFSTTESLVPADTNQGTDVYEYVEGRPRLITPGTGIATAPQTSKYTLGLASLDEVPGLIGVSANGTDVYFSTFDVLTPEDQNGDFFKFYDARTNGGFPHPAPPPPCSAAEECRSAGTAAPTIPAQGTAAHLSGGNGTPLRLHSHSARHRRHRAGRRRRRAR
jgi:DNA-binding beta-propeller fold protein YncE